MNLKIIWKIIKKWCNPITLWNKGVDWFFDTLSWLREAFTNWDAELYSFLEQIIDMAHRTANIIRIVVEKVSYAIREAGKVLSEMYRNLGFWK